MSYLIWIATCLFPNGRKRQTKALLKYIEEKPDTSCTIIGAQGAAWQNSLVSEVKAAVGASVWDEAFVGACQRYEIKADDARKKFAVVYEAARSLLASRTVAVLDAPWVSLSSGIGLNAGATDKGTSG